MAGAVKLGVLSDVHGNRHALDAVLEDGAAAGVDRWWALGDLVAIGPDPVAVLERLADSAGRRRDARQHRALHAHPRPAAPARGRRARPPGAHRPVRGRRGLVRLDPRRPCVDRLAPVAGRPSARGAHRAPGRHPRPRRPRDARDGTTATGSARSDPRTSSAGSSPAREADIVIAGHTHRPTDRWIGAVRAVNGGSVSNPITDERRASYVVIRAGCRRSPGRAPPGGLRPRRLPRAGAAMRPPPARVHRVVPAGRAVPVPLRRPGSARVGRLILWDIDGTLIRSGGVGRRVIEEAAAAGRRARRGAARRDERQDRPADPPGDLRAAALADDHIDDAAARRDGGRRAGPRGGRGTSCGRRARAARAWSALLERLRDAGRRPPDAAHRQPHRQRGGEGRRLRADRATSTSRSAPTAPTTPTGSSWCRSPSSGSPGSGARPTTRRGVGHRRHRQRPRLRPGRRACAACSWATSTAMAGPAGAADAAVPDLTDVDEAFRLLTA